MKVLDTIGYWVDLIVRIVMTIFLFIMTLVLAIQIGIRSVFQEGIIWTDELARYLMISMVFLGAAAAVRDKSHITVSIFEDWYPSLKKWLAPVQWTAILIYAVLLIAIGQNTLEVVAEQRSPNMGISMGVVYAVLPLSAVIMVIQLLGRLRKKDRNKKVEV
ncbi:TRAP transporter small permease [Salibacterium aidingense]|uniref:TRAP transporter small permease n=1 Tax=Salibacterium aidingense TaxID=384933 RepID=UPI003BE7C13B